MMSISFLWLVAEVAGGAVLMAQTVQRFDMFSVHTWPPIPLVWAGLGSAGFSVAAGALQGQIPHDWRIALAMVVMAGFAAIDRRRGG